MEYRYPYEKFLGALFSMAKDPRSIQERIATVYIYHLIHLKAEGLPEEIRHIFEEVQAKLTSKEPIGDEGRVMATVADMSTEEATEIAAEIVKMADVVMSHQRR